MITTFLHRFAWLAVLVAAQTFVFNHFHIAGYATPLPFVYLVLLFPMGTHRWVVMLWAFACGLLSDMAANTPGMGAGAMTLAAFIQPTLVKLMAPKEAAEDMQPSFKNLTFWVYVRYASILTSAFCLAYFLLQAFNFFHAVDLLITLLSSWLLTLLLCLLIEGLRKN